MDRETYSIAALAEAVGVPRTTINDWLNRYAGFIESEMSGKRRLYSARTVEVLKQVAALRDAGKSAAEIEQKLTDSFGIQPEVAAPKAPEAQPEKIEEPVATDAAAPDAVQLPALRKIEENALELAALIAEMRRRETRSARRSVWLLALIILLLAAFLAAGFGAWKIYASEKASHRAETQSRQQETAALQATICAMQEQLADAQIAANAEREADAKRYEALQGTLANEQQLRAAESERQQKQYEASLAAQKRDSEQLLREVKNGAAESEKRLQNEITRAHDEIKNLSGEVTRAHDEIKNLSGELAAQKERQTPPPEPPAPELAPELAPTPPAPQPEAVQ